MDPDESTVLDAFPDAPIDPDNVAFYRGLLERRFLVNRCAGCATWHFPARSICPTCWSTEVVPTEIGGDGTVYMIVRLHQGAPSGAEPGTPYPVATVELDEQLGLRVSTTLTGPSRDGVRIGTRVRLAWTERDGSPYPVFRALDETTGSA